MDSSDPCIYCGFCCKVNCIYSKRDLGSLLLLLRQGFPSLAWGAHFVAPRSNIRPLLLISVQYTWRSPLSS